LFRDGVQLSQMLAVQMVTMSLGAGIDAERFDDTLDQEKTKDKFWIQITHHCALTSSRRKRLGFAASGKPVSM
jgi:hypothetical protein